MKTFRVTLVKKIEIPVEYDIEAKDEAEAREIGQEILDEDDDNLQDRFFKAEEELCGEGTYYELESVKEKDAEMEDCFPMLKGSSSLIKARYSIHELSNESQDRAIRQFVEDAKDQGMDPKELRNPDNDHDRECIVACLEGCLFHKDGALVM